MCSKHQCPPTLCAQNSYYQNQYVFTKQRAFLKPVNVLINHCWIILDMSSVKSGIKNIRQQMTSAVGVLSLTMKAVSVLVFEDCVRKGEARGLTILKGDACPEAMTRDR